MKRATERSWTSRTFHDFLGIWAASLTIILLCTHPVCFAPAFCSHVRTKKLDAKSIRSSANALFLSAPLQKNGQSWAVMFSHGWPVERRPCPFLIGLMALGHICAWKQNKIGLNRCQMILMDTDVLTHRNWQHATSEHINYVTFKPWFLKARKTLALSCCKEDRDLPTNFIFHKYTGSTCFFGVCVHVCVSYQSYQSYYLQNRLSRTTPWTRLKKNMRGHGHTSTTAQWKCLVLCVAWIFTLLLFMSSKSAGEFAADSGNTQKSDHLLLKLYWHDATLKWSQTNFVPQNMPPIDHTLQETKLSFGALETQRVPITPGR